MDMVQLAYLADHVTKPAVGTLECMLLTCISLVAINTANFWRQHYGITDTALQYASTPTGSTDLMGICVSYASELLEPSFMPLDVCLGNTRINALHGLHPKIAALQLVIA